MQGQKRFGATHQQLAVPRGLARGPRHQADDQARSGGLGAAGRQIFPAPACPLWIADLKPRTIGSDYWQTGSDLIRSNSGIIQEPIANQTARFIAPGPRPRESASAQPTAVSPGECRKYFASIGAVLTDALHVKLAIFSATPTDVCC